MADQKLTELTNLATIADADLIYVVDDPSGSPTSKKITRLNLLTSAGIAGDITFSGAFHPIIAPGSDTDAVLLEVTVTGTPQEIWDESANAFSFNAGIKLTGQGTSFAIETAGGNNSFSDTAEMHTIFRVISDTDRALFDVDRARAGSAAVQSGDALGDFNFRGHTGTLYGVGTRFRGFAAENWVHGSNRGADMRFDTILNGTQALVERLRITNNGEILIGSYGGGAQLYVDQPSATGAKPVAYWDQADISEEFFEFNTTIGVGNAIEAIGAKTLTTTHFIKVTIPGPLTRYFPVGTIA